MIAGLELLAAVAWFLWSVIHWIYLCIHLCCGPIAVFVAFDKGLVTGARGVALAVLLFLLGLPGLIVALLLRTLPTKPEYPAAW